MPTCTNPIFFMHIAKTAGSYINAIFVNALGEESCILHSEHTLKLNFPEGDPIVQAVEGGGIGFISGHVYFKDWLETSKNTKKTFTKITTIRDPIAHLASHIQWLDHYNQPEMKREYNQLSSQIKLVVDEIAKIHFDRAGDIDDFLTKLSGSGVQLLDNCQSRYFVCGYGSEVSRTEPLSLKLTPTIQNSIDQFDIILTQDRLNDGLADISSLTGHALTPPHEHINKSKSLRNINTENRVIKSVLSKRCLVDQWLWRSVKHQSLAKNDNDLLIT